MSVFNCFRAMNVEHVDDSVAIYRTTLASSVLGLLFIFAGLGILIRLLLPGSYLNSMFGVCVFCLFVAITFIVIGLVLFTYKKRVVIDKANRKFEMLDASVLGFRKTAFGFDEISGIEISEDSECAVYEESGLWLVRIYISKLEPDGYRRFSRVERILATAQLHEAKEFSENIARICNVEIVYSYAEQKALRFVHS